MASAVHRVFLILVILVVVVPIGQRLPRTSAQATLLTKDELRAAFLNVSESNDLAALGTSGEENYVDSLFTAEQNMPWSASVPSNLLTDYVVPVRFYPSYESPTTPYYPEKIEDWRTPMYALAKQIIGNRTDPMGAAASLHDWVYANLPYLAQNQPAYLQPTLILATKGGSCWDSAILLGALYRSIFLPARIAAGQIYWRDTATATGTGVSGKDLQIDVMDAFWISRDWNIWQKHFEVYDQTAGTALKPGDYQSLIITINNAGRNSLIVTIPASWAQNHTFLVTFTYASPQGHYWTEVWIPGKGWIASDGEDQYGFDFAARLNPGYFDLQTYNPARRAWSSSYFNYGSFNQPIDTMLSFAEDTVNQSSGLDAPVAKSQLAQAEEYYKSFSTRQLSPDERQAVGDHLFDLAGQAATIALSNDTRSLFLNVWDVTQINPSTLASEIASNGTRNIGILFPYDVFDFPRIKALYAPLGSDMPYEGEVKREYYWVNSFKSALAAESKLYLVVEGYDPMDRQWKVAVTIADAFTTLESAASSTLWTTTRSLRFKIDGASQNWPNLQPIITAAQASQAGNPAWSINKIYGATDDKFLYIRIEVQGKPYPGNNYIVPLDVTGSGHWDYSFGFSKYDAWMYDLRGIKNGQWPDSRLSTPPVSYAVGDVAEIAIPLTMVGQPTHVWLEAWINVVEYGALQTVSGTVAWGSVISLANTTITAVSSTQISPSIHTTTSSAPSHPLSLQQNGNPILSWAIAAMVVTGILLVLVFLKKHRNKHS